MTATPTPVAAPKEMAERIWLGKHKGNLVLIFDPPVSGGQAYIRADLCPIGDAGCEWTNNPLGNRKAETTCGEAILCTDGFPEARFKFCPFCSKKIK